MSRQEAITVRPACHDEPDADYGDEASKVYLRAPGIPSSAVFMSPVANAADRLAVKRAWAERRMMAGRGTPRLQALLAAATLRQDELLLDSVLEELQRR